MFLEPMQKLVNDVCNVFVKLMLRTRARCRGPRRRLRVVPNVTSVISCVATRPRAEKKVTRNETNDEKFPMSAVSTATVKVSAC